MSLRRAAQMLANRVTELTAEQAASLGDALGLIHRNTGHDDRDARRILARLVVAVPDSERDAYVAEVDDGT